MIKVLAPALAWNPTVQKEADEMLANCRKCVKEINESPSSVANLPICRLLLMKKAIAEANSCREQLAGSFKVDIDKILRPRVLLEINALEDEPVAADDATEENSIRFAIPPPAINGKRHV